MSKESVLKFKILLILTVVVIFVITFLSFLQYRLLTENIRQNVLSESNRIFKTYDLLVGDLKTQLKRRLEKPLRNETVVRALQQADRQSLYNSTRSTIENLFDTSPYLLGVEFLTPQGRTLLRIDQKEGERERAFSFLPDPNGPVKLAERVVVGLDKTKAQVIAYLNLHYLVSKIKQIFPASYMLLSRQGPSGDPVPLEGDTLLMENSGHILHTLTPKSWQIREMYIDKTPYSFTKPLQISVTQKETEIFLLFAHDTSAMHKRFETMLYHNIISGAALILLVVTLVHFALNYLFKTLRKTRLKLERLNQTLEKNIAEATTELREYNKAITDSYIVSKTDPRGLITYVNEAFCRVTGYEKRELLGRDHRILKHPGVPSETFAPMWETILQKRVYKSLVKNRTKRGHTVYFNSTVIPILDRNKTIKEFIALRFDVTKEIEYMKKLKATMEDLVKKDQALIHQSKMAQMGEMISMIAHQWRQPLSAIAATTTDLKFKLELDQFEREYFADKLESLTGYTSHLSKTIDDFRNFFKQNRKKHIVGFETIVTNALDIIGESLRNKGIALSTEFHCAHRMHIYPNELQQVVLNLLKNAEDSLLDTKPHNPRISVSTHTKESYSCLTVSDNGGGIPAEIMDKIFDPYFSTKKKKDGTGLGLYMSKTIVEEHCGGIISVANQDGGAAFTIAIPFSKEFSDG